jgi:endonuclease/exonuclease/phosphatase family metal-dependent hydrolase
VKLVQLNIWQGRLIWQILPFIAREQPDILCLQEVFSCEDEVKIPDLMCKSLQLITDKTGYEHVLFSPTFSTTFADARVEFGTAIVSKYPLHDTETIFINGQFMPDQNAKTYVPNTRNLQFAAAKLPDGSTLSLANHHGYWEPSPVGSEITVSKSLLVKKHLERMSQPLIFTGDLNVTAASNAMRPFDGFLEDLTATHRIDSTLSPLAKVQNVACDHILVSDTIKVQRFEVSDDLLSDHKALVLEFSL